MLDTTWTASLKWQSKGTESQRQLIIESLSACVFIFNYNIYISARRQQSEEGEKNGSEDDDEEKPGKRVMGPRKKFLWDDKLRSVSRRKGGRERSRNV